MTLFSCTGLGNWSTLRDTDVVPQWYLFPVFGGWWGNFVKIEKCSNFVIYEVLACPDYTVGGHDRGRI